MKKNTRTMLIVLGIIAALIFFGQGKDIRKTAQADVSNAYIERSASTKVKAGTVFPVTYTAKDYGVGSWGVLIEDVITSGTCEISVFGGQNIDTGFISEQSHYVSVDIDASGSSCTFDGTYVFPPSTDKNIVPDPLTIEVCTDECTIPSRQCNGNDVEECVLDVCTFWSYVTTCSVSCTNGQCDADCDALREAAINAIFDWIQGGDRQAALDAIVAWATDC